MSTFLEFGPNRFTLYYLDSNSEEKFEEKWRLMERKCGREINVEQWESKYGGEIEVNKERTKVDTQQMYRFKKYGEITHVPLFIL